MVAHVLTVQEVEGGFPHSEILGSKLVRSSPRLIAAYHVLHRLSAPRHPPDALMTLDRSHDRCPPPLAGRRTSVRKDHACQPCPGERPLRGASWSAGDVVSRNPNMVPLHDVKHPRTRPWSSPERGGGVSTRSSLRRSRRGCSWWSRTGSNRRPHACKARALPTELRPHGEQRTRRQRSPP